MAIDSLDSLSCFMSTKNKAGMLQLEEHIGVLIERETPTVCQTDNLQAKDP